MHRCCKVGFEAKLDTIDKKRGNKLAIKALIDRYEETRIEEISKTVYICSADCMEDAENLKSQLLEKYPDLKIRVTVLSPIIGAHTGPDMLALIHYGKKRQ